MKKRFFSLLPLFLISSIFFGVVLVSIGTKYVKTTLTKSLFDLQINVKPEDDGLNFTVDIINGGSLDISLALIRIRIHDDHQQYIWFSNWDFNRETDIIEKNSSKQYNLFMEMPESKLEQVQKTQKPLLFVTGVFEIKGIGDINFNKMMVVNLDE